MPAIDYRGNFDNYVRLRDEHIKNAMRVYQAYHTKRAHMMEFIEKFRANAKRATMVQSRVKAVEKMDAEAPEPVESEQVWRFSIPASEPLSRPIIAVDDVSFDYNREKEDGTKKKEEEFLLQKVNFGIDLSSRIAILGANGQGSYQHLISSENGGVRAHMFFHFFRQDDSIEPNHGKAKAITRVCLDQWRIENRTFHSTSF